MICSHETHEWLEKFVQKLLYHMHINVKFKLSCIICDPPSESKPYLHLVIFWEIPFWNIQLQKNQPQLCIEPVCVSSKILSYLLVFIIANLLYLWWLNFMVFLTSVSAISIANGEGGWDGRRGGVGWDELGRWRRRWQKPLFGTPHEQPWCPHSGHWHTSGPRSQWEQTQVPTAQLVPSMGAIVPAMTLEDRQNALEKSRPVNIEQLTHWGWIELSVSVSCGNKTEFSFGANYVGFAKTVTYYIINMYVCFTAWMVTVVYILTKSFCRWASFKEKN